MSILQRIPLPARAILLCLLGSFVVLLLAFYLLTQTEAGREYLARLVSSGLSSADTIITIGKISGHLPAQIELQAITVEDQQGKWLTLDSARIVWSPLALMQGQVNITDARLDGLLLARRPVSGKGPAPDILTSITHALELPFSLSLKQMIAESMELAEPVLGELLRVRLSGSAVVTKGGIAQTDLRIEALQGVPESITLSARFDAQGKTLNLDASLREPEGGVIARALNLPHLIISLKGTGPLHNWQARLDATGGNTASIQAAVNLELKSGKHRFSTQGKANIAQLINAAEKSLLQDVVSFEADADFTDISRIVIESARLTSDAGSLELAGILSERDSELQAGLSLANKGIRWLNDFNPPNSVSNLLLNARISGPILKPQIQLEFDALDLTAAQLTAATLRGQLNLEFERVLTDGILPVEVKGNGELDGVQSAHPEWGELLGNQLAFNLHTHVGKDSIEINEFQLIEGTATISAAGQIGIAPHSMNLELSADVPDLTRIGTLPDSVLAGRALLKAQIQSTDLTRGLQATLAGEISDLQLAEPAASALTGPSVLIHAAVGLDAEGALHVTDLDLRGAAISLQGDVALPPGLETVEARYHARIENLAGKSAAARGILLEGKVFGRSANPELSGKILIKQAKYDALTFGATRVDYGVDQITSSPEGYVSISVEESAWGAISAESRFTVEDFTTVRLYGLQLNSGESRAEGELSITINSGLVEGRVKGHISDLNRWEVVAQRNLAGQLTFDIALREDRAEQIADVKLRAKDIVIAHDSSTRVSSKKLKAEATIRDVFSAPRGNLAIEAEESVLGDADLSSLLLEVELPDAQRADLNLTLSGDLHGPLEISAGGQITWPGKEVSVALQNLRGQISGQPMQLLQPAQLLFGSGQLSVDQLQLLIGAAKILADGGINADAVELDVEVSRLKLEQFAINRAAPGLKGTLSGVMRVRGSRTAPTGQAELELTDLYLTVPAELAGLDGSLSGTWRDNRLSIKGELSGLSATALTIVGELPLTLVPDAVRLRVPEDDPVSARISWQGEIEPLFELLGLHDHHVSGMADLAVDIGGTLNAPKINGGLDLSKGEYENRVSGTLITNASIALKSDGQTVVVAGSANDSGNGRISIRGSMEHKASLLVNLELIVDKAVLVGLDELTASATGQARLSGPITNTLLSGQFVVNQVEARVTNGSAAKIIELEVVEINRPRDAAQAENQTKSEDPAVINLDVTLDMPGKVFLRGQGLESEWAGKLQVSGTDDQPLIRGELRPVRGGFSFAGKEFKLKSGSVRFDSSSDIDPILNLPGEYAGQDITAIISITGRASNPEIQLTSRPPLPQSQILSQVLFDQEAEELTAGQKVELAAAMANLTGRGGGDVLDKARRSLGVDTLTLREGREGNGAKLSAGKYLTDKVYVELEKGAQEEPGTATIELEVAPKVKVETGSKGNGDGKVGIKWRWDY